jgi:hypothetical protein
MSVVRLQTWGLISVLRCNLHDHAPTAQHCLQLKVLRLSYHSGFCITDTDWLLTFLQVFSRHLLTTALELLARLVCLLLFWSRDFSTVKTEVLYWTVTMVLVTYPTPCQYTAIRCDVIAAFLQDTRWGSSVIRKSHHPVQFVLECWRQAVVNRSTVIVNLFYVLSQFIYWLDLFLFFFFFSRYRLHRFSRSSVSSFTSRKHISVIN